MFTTPATATATPPLTPIAYLPDASVDAALDAEIRTLLTTCFKKPQDTIFATQRYFREPYPDRWVSRDAEGRLVAHIGVHAKTVQAAGIIHPIAGIAEVCVHPDYRGQGTVGRMLEIVHDRMRAAGRDFALLFGNPAIYRSSGYVAVDNLVHDADKPGGDTRREPIAALVRPLTDIPWPAGEVYLPGPSF